MTLKVLSHGPFRGSSGSLTAFFSTKSHNEVISPVRRFPRRSLGTSESETAAVPHQSPISQYP